MLLVVAAPLAAATRTFEITARQFTYDIDPFPFVVDQGDDVTLHVTATDTDHGFFVEHYSEIGDRIQQNHSRTVHFIASQPGTFTVFCTFICGIGHGNMNTTFTVKAAAIAAPTVTSVTPTSGAPGGGAIVTILGTGFQNGATVKFGDADAIGVSVNDATHITATAPPHAAGAVAVTVTNPDSKLASLASAFVYVTPSAQPRRRVSHH
jgi:hypothetical protein